MVVLISLFIPILKFVIGIVGEETPPSSREGESTPEQMSSTQKSEMLMRERAPLIPRVTYI